MLKPLVLEEQHLVRAHLPHKQITKVILELILHSPLSQELTLHMVEVEAEHVLQHMVD